jgi:hypothetical protein
MRKLLITLLVLSFMAGTSAQAHQPVDLLTTDTTAAKGPLLVDGTISYAVRAAFTKAGEKKGFRAAFAEGDGLSVEYLIVDKKPENTLRPTQLPTLVMTSPKGKSLTIKFTERTKFPYSGVNYLYLARYKAVAEAGEYSFLVTAKRKASIILAVGVKEIPGEVLRGPKPTPSVTPAPATTPSAAASSTPTPTPAPTKVGYTMTQVRANNTAANCWAVIDDSVYDLTNWIKSHPGGSGAIVGLCGTDGSAAFSIKHGNQSRPAAQLNSYRLGPLAK